MSLKEAVVNSIEDLRKNPPAELEEDLSCSRILMALDFAQESNGGWSMAGLCGTSSYMLWEHLPGVMAKKGFDIKIGTALAEHEQTFAHVYNPIVDMRHPEEEIICDLSIAQFISSPLTLFDGKPYFVGSRRELKELVLSLREKTLLHMQSNFPHLGMRTYADIDHQKETDRAFFDFYYKARERYSENLLLTEKQENAWEKAWGDQSRYRPIFNYSMPHLHQGK